MGCGNQKISNNCGENIYSPCVIYEGDLGLSTKIDSECVSVHDTVEDIYSLLDDNNTNLDVSGLGDSCLTYTLVEDQLLVKNVLLKFEEKICEAIADITALENFDYGALDITGFGLDFNVLQDPCGDPITTLSQLLQVLINQVIS